MSSPPSAAGAARGTRPTGSRRGWPGRRCSRPADGPVSAGRSSSGVVERASPGRSSSTRSTCGRAAPGTGRASSAKDCSVPPSSSTGPTRNGPGSSHRSVAGTELWCQGYSEPDAGSDLANVQTRAVLDGDQWVVTGQKVWTSLAHQADWCFVVCRTDPGSTRHQGLSYLLVPMDQPGVEVRPITQLTRTSEFNEVFFDGARTEAENVVGERGRRVAGRAGHPGLRAGRRPPRPPAHLPSRARPARRGGPSERCDAATRWCASGWPAPTASSRSCATTRCGACRAIDGPVAPPEASIIKLYWASWHQRLGELAMDVWQARRGSCSSRRPTSSTNSSGPSCSAGRRPSTAGRTRSSGTSSASGCSACRPSRRGTEVEARGATR